MKKNETILIFTGYFFPHLGGIEAYINGFTKQLVKKGYNPVIVTSNHQNLKDKEMIDGVTIYRIPIFNIFKERYPIPKKNRVYKNILKELEQYNFKAIIVNTRFHLTSHIGAAYGKKHNIPVYLIEHGSNYVTLDNKFIDFFANNYERFLTWKIKNKISGFYGVSEACNKWLKRIKINASGVWYNAVEYGQKVPKREKHTKINFIYAGRLIKQKGVLNVLNAFSELEKKYNNVHLFIAGNGPEYDSYFESFKSKNIEFLGKLDFQSLLKYYSLSDVLLYTPLWPEGLPSTILESGLMKLCVVVTNQGGICEIVNDENGIIVDGSEKSIYDAMELIVSNNKIAKNLSNKLYKDVKEKFSWEVVADKILKDIGVEK